MTSLPGVFLRPSAIEDLRDIFLFLSKGNTTRANKFALNARQTMLDLVASPYLGSPREFSDLDSELHSMRRWPVADFRDYGIFYRPFVSGNGIDVFSVIHVSRDAGSRLRAALDE